MDSRSLSGVEVPGVDHSTAREEFTNIRIDRAGRWFTGAKEIVNYKVISHFKQNLFRDDKGVYIYQTFRQFAEKGYIRIEGPLLSVFRIDENKITLDSLDTIPADRVRVVVDSADNLPYVYYERLGCFASIPAAVAADFSAHMREGADGYFLYDRRVEECAICDWAASPPRG